MTVIDRLQDIGYVVGVDGDSITWHWTGHGFPDPELVRPLLAEVRQHKAEVLAALRHEHAFESVRDTFVPGKRLPDGLMFVIEDLEREIGYVAWRTGDLELRGYGGTGIEAVRDLERREGL